MSRPDSDMLAWEITIAVHQSLSLTGGVYNGHSLKFVQLFVPYCMADALQVVSWFLFCNIRPSPIAPASFSFLLDNFNT